MTAFVERLHCQMSELGSGASETLWDDAAFRRNTQEFAFPHNAGRSSATNQKAGSRTPFFPVSSQEEQLPTSYFLILLHSPNISAVFFIRSATFTWKGQRVSQLEQMNNDQYT